MGKDKNRKEGIPLPPEVGLRRSARLQNLPPSSEGGTNDNDPPGEVSSGDGVNVSVQGSSKKVDGGGDASLEAGSGGKRSQGRRQSLPLEDGKPQAKVGGEINELGQAPASPPGVRTRSATAAAGRSEVKSSEAQTEEEEAHPCLFIENILDEIFKYVVEEPEPRTNVATNVQNIRLVCKTWNTSITRLYRRTYAEATFSRYDQRGIPGRGLNTLTQFMKVMKSSPMIPVLKFAFIEQSFSRKNLKMFREFILLCGPQTLELLLSIDSRDADWIMQNLEGLPTLELKKLKTLYVRIYEDHQRPEDSKDRALVKLFELLLTSTTTLGDVWLKVNNSGPNPRKHDRLLEKLSLVIAEKMPTTVKKLELDVELNETAFNNLAGMQAKLERVGLFVPSELESGSMYTFLQSQAGSLKDLEFSASLYHTKLVVQFPRLGELVSLQLPSSHVSISIASSHFAETFPKLHSLVMTTTTAISEVLSTVKKPSESLKVLDIRRCRFTCPPPFVKDMARSFPGLVKLTIGLQEDEPETTVEVFKHLDRLESLHISFSDFSQDRNWVDSLFSGITEADCRRLGLRGEFGDLHLNEFRSLPSIHNLKHLKQLKIEEHHGAEKVAFSDVSAHFVFLEMDHLRQITMPITAAQFSPRYLELLKDKLVLRPAN